MKKIKLTLLGLFYLINIHAQIDDVITNLSYPSDLLFDGDIMYFIEANSVSRIDVSSGSFTVEPIFTGFTGAGSGLALGDGILYFADFYDGQIWKMDITVDNPIAEILVDGLHWPNMLEIDDTILYYTENTGFASVDTIGKIDLTDPNPQGIPLLSISTAYGIEIYGDELFYSEENSNGISNINKISLTSSNPVPEQLFSGINSLRGLSRSGSDIYASARDDDKILKFNPSCGSVGLQTVVSNVSDPRQTAIHGDFLYILSYEEMKISRTPIVDQTSSIDIQEACNSYTWQDGITYTSSTNEPTYVVPNVIGCDSVITLNLTIGGSPSTDIQTACSDFTWIDGVTYTASTDSATYTYVLNSGCDSIVTLDLIINNNTTYTDVQTACNEYTWIDGNVYTESNNTATFSLANFNGCDSIVALDLTINQITTNAIALTGDNVLAAVAVDADYQWLDCTNGYTPIIGETNQTFTPNSSGAYAVQIVQNDCIDTSTCRNVIITSIDEMNLYSSVKIYPNPTRDEVVIDFGNLRNIDIVLYSPLGELLLEDRLNNDSEYKLSLDENAGVYFLRIRFGEASRVYRIIKI